MMTHPVDPPALHIPRACLELVESLGYARPRLSYQEIHNHAQASEPTLKEHLRYLVRHSLILHVRYGEYAIPHRSTLGRLLIESDPYRRSVFLHHDVLALRGESVWAFLCLPIKRIIDMEIPRAIPVLHPDQRLKKPAGRPYPDALWYAFDPARRRTQTLASTGEEETDRTDPQTLPVLQPLDALALLAATLDPRFVQAAQTAAKKTGTSADRLNRQARALHPETPPLKAIHPNTVVFPKWLARHWKTAQRQHARTVLR